ncbi:unnamed protein product [Caenorhabditis angaria]|uniref:FHF complex subunit HOOK-interacting protein C-terminal domain-containing protein n=1 Tax=Caenorhabditis angaria TaxID=860376 RepID=A0A9P1MZF5_9PELO|nr:unnamed protein product [Caenorhabditis angaria]
MIRWLNKISSPLSADSSPKNSARNELFGGSARAKWSSAYASDPTEWERIFEDKNRIVDEILEKKLSNVEHDVNYDEMMVLLENITNMCTLLMLEVNSQPEPSIGPILDRFFTEQILERVIDWAIQLPPLLKPTCQLSLVRIYENIVSESHSQNHCVLVHKPILNPLLRLCEWSRRVDTYWHLINAEVKRSEPSITDKHFVLLLNQICTKLAEDRTLLHFFFTCSNGSEQFIVFTQLITFLYEQSDIGQLARDALLLILSVSAEHEQIATFVANKTAFCPVVATGLSGCFSQLPRSILGDGGERFVEDDYSDALSDFHASILFCNAVAQSAHKDVVKQISAFFYTGFLINVVKPALLQDDRQYIAASLAYLQLCIETITEPMLLRSIIRMLLTERDENSALLFERILSYTKSGDKASVVAISLLDTLMKLCCEDIMLAMIFRPLLTNHLANKKQLAKVQNRLRCQELSQKYLDCIPKCMENYKEVVSESNLSGYMRETRLRMDARAEQCNKNWRWKYDGVVADSFCLPSESDDDATCHVSFSRLSSSRSSMSTAAFGLNRYLNSKNSHLTHEFNIDKVCGLGENQNSDQDDYKSDNDNERNFENEEEEEIEEDNHFVLPPIDEMTTSKVMTSSCIDYLHISGLDDFSESDDSAPILSKRSTESENESNIPPQNSFVLSGWQEIKDETTFRSLLEKQKIGGKLMNGKDICDFIEEKLEKLNLAKGKIEEKENGVKLEEEELKTTKTGFSVYNFPERSSLLKFLFESVEMLCENSLSFNTELCSLIITIVSYPQPILAYFLLDLKEDKSDKCFLTILQSVQTRIEVMAEGIEGFDNWVQRALKSLELRAARINKQSNKKSPTEEESTSSLFFGRAFGGSMRKAANFRMHTHKHIDNLENQRDDATAKQTALAAIFVAHLSQTLASVVFQQSLII